MFYVRFVVTSCVVFLASVSSFSLFAVELAYEHIDAAAVSLDETPCAVEHSISRGPLVTATASCDLSMTWSWPAVGTMSTMWLPMGLGWRALGRGSVAFKNIKMLVGALPVVGTVIGYLWWRHRQHLLPHSLLSEVPQADPSYQQSSQEEFFLQQGVPQPYNHGDGRPPFIVVADDVDDIDLQDDGSQRPQNLFEHEVVSFFISNMLTTHARYSAHLSNAEFYAKISRQTFKYYLEYLDISKMFFTNGDIQDLTDGYAHRWLTQLIHNRDDTAIRAVQELRYLRIVENYQQRLKILQAIDDAGNDIYQTLGDVSTQQLDLENHSHGYAEDTADKIERVKKDILFHHATFKAMFPSRFFGGFGDMFLRSANVLYRKSLNVLLDRNANRAYHYDLIMQSVMRNFSTYSDVATNNSTANPDRSSGTKLSFHYLNSEDRTIALSLSEGVAKIRELSLGLKHDGLLKIGDIVLGASSESFVSERARYHLMLPVRDLSTFWHWENNLNALDIFYRNQSKNARYLKGINLIVLRKRGTSQEILHVPLTFQDENHSISMQKPTLASSPALDAQAASHVFRDHEIHAVGYLRLPTFDYNKQYSQRDVVMGDCYKDFRASVLRKLDRFDYDDMARYPLDNCAFFKSFQYLMDNKVGAMILDLRGNRGGSAIAQSMVALSFVQKSYDYAKQYEYRLDGEVSAEGSEEKFNHYAQDIKDLLFEHYNQHYGVKFHGPLIILADGETSSASEMVMQELKAQGRALIIGSPSGGKNVSTERLDIEQFIDELPKRKRSQLKSMSNFSYFTLRDYTRALMKHYFYDDRSFPDTGIVPDIALPSIDDAYQYSPHVKALQDPVPLFPQPSEDELHHHDAHKEPLYGMREPEIIAQLQQYAQDLWHGSSDNKAISEWIAAYNAVPLSYEFSLHHEDYRLRFQDEVRQQAQPFPVHRDDDYVLAIARQVAAKYQQLLVEEGILAP